ncbi:hypothetical protein BKA62DRAFT_833474 [Auriculariales sp. MPI-PUGE-AT-0066]|nr:hypothetical protein BKA62DRAFT_833474 [Auriculariales sp. MPI-PUGE-AT-0066]
MLRRYGPPRLKLITSSLSGKLFVFAATAVRYVGSPRGSPIRRLEEITRAAEGAILVGAHEPSPYAALDALYIEVLLRATDPNDRDPSSNMNRSIRLALALITSVKADFGAEAISTLLMLGRDQVDPLLRSLCAVLDLPDNLSIESYDHPIVAFHNSFSNFLLDPKRCTDARFHIPVPQVDAFLSAQLLLVVHTESLPLNAGCTYSRADAVIFSYTYWFHHFLRGAACRDTVLESITFDVSSPEAALRFKTYFEEFSASIWPNRKRVDYIILEALDGVRSIFAGFLRFQPDPAMKNVKADLEIINADKTYKNVKADLQMINTDKKSNTYVHVPRVNRVHACVGAVLLHLHNSPPGCRAESDIATFFQ